MRSLPYRRNVGIMMLNADGLALVGHRVDMKADAWQMPQGGIDDGETPLFAESGAQSPQRIVSGLRRFLAARHARSAEVRR